MLAPLMQSLNARPALCSGQFHVRNQRFIVSSSFNGHNHAGNDGGIAGKHFLNFTGMVDTPAASKCAALAASRTVR
jgi:hypothetical protein